MVHRSSGNDEAADPPTGVKRSMILVEYFLVVFELSQAAGQVIKHDLPRMYPDGCHRFYLRRRYRSPVPGTNLAWMVSPVLRENLRICDEILRYHQHRR
jgi:hypothetical protein